MTAVNESMLEIAINAAGSGHDLGPFEPVEDGNGKPNGHQARCRRCEQSAWVDDTGLMYSLLDDVCPGEGR